MAPFVLSISNYSMSDDRIGKWKVAQISNSNKLYTIVLVQESTKSKETIGT